jgi:hypothetical protein
MSDVERYLKRAAELEQIARESFIPEHRRALLEVAEDWRQMAAKALAAETRTWRPPAQPEDV